MSNKYYFQTIYKSENNFLVSGVVATTRSDQLHFQLTDQFGANIPFFVSTVRAGKTENTAFWLYASDTNSDTFILSGEDGELSFRVKIDSAYLSKQKWARLIKRVNPQNVKKAMKFYREYGMKNALLRTRSEIQRQDILELDYNLWKPFFDPTEEELEHQRNAWKDFSFAAGKAPLISVVIPAYNTDRQMLLLLLDSFKEQTYPNFEVLIADGSSPDNRTVKDTLDSYSQEDSRFIYIPVEGNQGISGNTNAGLSRVNGDFVAFCDHDDSLPPWALYEIVKAISENPRVQFLYTDEDKVDIDGVTFFDPHFKSDYNLFLLESCNYISHFNVVRKDLLDRAGFLSGDYDGAQDFDFVLRCSDVFAGEEEQRLERFREALTETTDIAELSARSGLLEDSVQELLDGRFISELAVHIPKVCYHWRCSPASTAFDSRSKMYAYEAGCKAVRDHHLRCNHTFKEVVNSRNFGFYRTVFSDDAKDAPQISVVLRDQGYPQYQERCEQSLRASGYPNLEILPVKDASLNETIAQATGEYVLLLDNRLVLKDNINLYEMTAFLNRPNVGAVGARLLDKDGTTWSAGQIINKEELAVPAFRGLHEYEGSYMHRMMCTQSLSSLDGECMLVRTSLLKRLSGFDDALTGDLAATDLCLRIRQLGYLLVYTPYAVFEKQGIVFESTEKNDAFAMDEKLFRKKWKGFLKHTDPYYNPQFLPNAARFHIGINLNEKEDLIHNT